MSCTGTLVFGSMTPPLKGNTSKQSLQLSDRPSKRYVRKCTYLPLLICRPGDFKTYLVLTSSTKVNGPNRTPTASLRASPPITPKICSSPWSGCRPTRSPSGASVQAPRYLSRSTTRSYRSCRQNHSATSKRPAGSSSWTTPTSQDIRPCQDVSTRRASLCSSFIQLPAISCHWPFRQSPGMISSTRQWTNRKTGF